MGSSGECSGRWRSCGRAGDAYRWLPSEIRNLQADAGKVACSRQACEKLAEHVLAQDIDIWLTTGQEVQVFRIPTTWELGADSTHPVRAADACGTYTLFHELRILISSTPFLDTEVPFSAIRHCMFIFIFTLYPASLGHNGET